MYRLCFWIYNKKEYKIFATLTEAIEYSIFKVPYGGAGEIIKIANHEK